MTSLGGICCFGRTYCSEKFVISNKSLGNSDAGVALHTSLGICVTDLLNVTVRVPLSLIPGFFFSPLGSAGGSEGDSGLPEGHGSAACCQRDHLPCRAEAAGGWQAPVWLCLAGDAQPRYSEGNKNLPQHLPFPYFVFPCGVWGPVSERPDFPFGPDIWDVGNETMEMVKPKPEWSGPWLLLGQF